MNSTLRKVALSTATALAILSAAPLEAQAQHRRHWHGGGWQGHGWHGGHWHGHGGRSNRWVGPAVAGLIGGLALGAIAGSSAYAYGPAYAQPYYGGCYWQDRPAIDAWGRFVGYRTVQVCY